MAITNHWISEYTTIDPSVGPSYYNSALSLQGAGPTTNAKLTIYLRLLMLPEPTDNYATFYRPDPKDATKKVAYKVKYVPNPNPLETVYKQIPVEVREWGSQGDRLEFKLFQEKVKFIAEDFWNNTGLCLIPPPDCADLKWGSPKPSHMLNVECGFEIVWASGVGDAHVVVYCACIDQTNQDTFTIRSALGGGKGWFDTGDIVSAISHHSGPATDSEVVANNCIPHEIGHALGLPHIGVTTGYLPCLNAAAAPNSGGTNHAMCYSGPNPEDGQNVMGFGLRIALRNGDPWLLRAARHTNTDVKKWKIQLKTEAPKAI